MQTQNGTFVIKREQISEYEVHKFEAEASALGLPPGTWPSVIEVTPKLGNGEPLLCARHLKSWGEVVGVVYRQAFGRVELVIQND